MPIKEKLPDNLRALNADGIMPRAIFPEALSRVSDAGESLRPVFRDIKDRRQMARQAQ